MTAKQFRKKFPAADTNDNCLRDIACPSCGSRGRFDIEVSTVAKFDDMGSDDTGDMEWSDDSFIGCRACNHSGQVADFTIQGLDS